MAWDRFRKLELDYEPTHKYPYVVTAWCNLGGVECGDRYTEQVGDILIESLREDGITVEVSGKED